MSDSKEKVTTKTEESSVDKKVIRGKREASGPKRASRKSLRNVGPLSIAKEDKDPNYQYRWANDTIGNLDRKLQLGYEFVLDSDGNPVYKMDRQGDDIFKKFLMRTPNELYEEGKKEKRDENKEYESAMTSPDPSKGQYGEGLSKKTIDE